jgi:hypothetical protein
MSILLSMIILKRNLKFRKEHMATKEGPSLSIKRKAAVRTTTGGKGMTAPESLLKMLVFIAILGCS